MVSSLVALDARFEQIALPRHVRFQLVEHLYAVLRKIELIAQIQQCVQPRLPSVIHDKRRTQRRVQPLGMGRIPAAEVYR